MHRASIPTLILALALTGPGCSCGSDMIVDVGLDAGRDAPVDDAPPGTDTPTEPDAPTVDAPDAPSNHAPRITSTPPTTIDIELAPAPDFTTIELTPADVGSTSGPNFSTLPTDDPSTFGFSGADVRGVDFDFLPDGTAIADGAVLSDGYASLGLVMENIAVSSSVYEGAASPPNATYAGPPGATQRFLFAVPVVAVGIVNTSPDQDTFEFYDVDGELIHRTRDQDSAPGPNFNVDRFVGARTNNDRLIHEMRLVNATGQMELDELIFEVSTELLARGALDYTVTATDEDGDVLTYSIVSGPDGASIDPVTGVIDWQPTNLDEGDHTFVVRVEDGHSGADEQTFVVTVVVTTPTT